MNAPRVTDTLAPVTIPPSSGNKSRGAKIERRMEALTMTVADLAREAGEQGRDMSRKTVYRAFAGEPEVTDRTYKRLENALTRLEQDSGEGSPDAILSTEQGLIEFEVTGDFGVRVVVKGPIENAAELEKSVARLIRDIRDTPKD
jgi:transcriptional regulator with XRE-family HTH domain